MPPSKPLNRYSFAGSDEHDVVEESPNLTINAPSPLDPLRKGNVILELGGAGALCIGSDLLISLYVTGPPRLSSYTSPATAILLTNLLLGGLACIPSWIGVMVLLCEGEQPLNEPPQHGRLLRICAILAFLVATLYGFSAIVLFVLLQAKDSFVAFCLQNLRTEDETACNDRWNREWLILVVAAIVLIYHVGMGFPVYHYARGTQYGPQNGVGYLFEMTHERRASFSDQEDDDSVSAQQRSRRREGRAGVNSRRYHSIRKGQEKARKGYGSQQKEEEEEKMVRRPRRHRRAPQGSSESNKDSSDSL